MRVTGGEARLVPRTTASDRSQEIEEVLDEQLAGVAMLIRKYPVPSIMGALAIGLLLGITLGRR